MFGLLCIQLPTHILNEVKFNEFKWTLINTEFTKFLIDVTNNFVAFLFILWNSILFYSSLNKFKLDELKFFKEYL